MKGEQILTEADALNDIGVMMSEFVDNWPNPKRLSTALALIAKTLRIALDPPRHKFWGAGEPDCPREIKAGNGELHTLRCKVCGENNPRNDRCLPRATLMDKMLELADRCEKASGPDRELDREIHEALFGMDTVAIGDCRTARFYRTWDGDRSTGLPSPYWFTGSVDDAEKVLPGLEWPEWQITRRFCTGYHANVGLRDDGVGCETPALALCAAALRARAKDQSHAD